MRKKKISNLITLYITGDLSAKEAADVEKIINKDDALLKEYQHARELIESVSEVEVPETKPGFANRLKSNIKAETGRESTFRLKLFPVMAGLLTAMLVVLSLWIFTNGGDIEQTEDMIVERIAATERLNGYLNPSVEILNDEELQYLDDELCLALKEEMGIDTSTVNNLGNYVEWNPALDIYYHENALIDSKDK